MEKQKYRVHLYTSVRVPYVVEATSQLQAIEKAEESADLEKDFVNGEFADEVTSVLVDEANDTDYSKSCSYVIDKATGQWTKEQSYSCEQVVAKAAAQGSPEPLRLVAPAHNTYGEAISSPTYCVIDLDAELQGRIQKMTSLCEEHDLSEVRTPLSPSLWGPAGIEEEARLTQPELVVCRGGGFYFTDIPKHEDGQFETDLLFVEHIQKISDKKLNGVVFYNDDMVELFEKDHTAEMA